MPYPTRFKSGCVLILTTLFILLSAAMGLAETFTWNGAVSSSWNDPDNWTDSLGAPGEPGSADTAVIPSTGVTTAPIHSSGTNTISILTCNSALSITGGTLNIASTTTASSVAGGVTLTLSGGVLSGAATLEIDGTLDWRGGIMNGSGATNINGSTATMTIQSGTQKRLDTRTINNIGTITFTSTSPLFIQNAAAINNQSGGTFDVQSDITVLFKNDTTLGTFTNAGTFRKSAGTGTATVQMKFDNTNAVEANSGTLEFVQGGTSSSSFTAGTGATLSFTGSTNNHEITLAGAKSISGAGTVDFAGGTTNFQGTYSVSGSTTITGGTINFNSSASTAGLTLSSGTLGGSGTVTVTGAATWSGGTMAGSGETTFQSALDINYVTGSQKFLDTRTININNNSTATFNSTTAVTALINVQNAGQFNILSGGIFDIKADVEIFGHNTGTEGKITNSGTFKKTSGTGTATVDVAFDNPGTVEVQTGTIEFTRGGSSTGTFSNTASDAKTAFSTKTYNLNSGTQFTGSGYGRINYSGATEVFNVNGSVGATNIELVAGKLDGSGVLTVSGALNWSSGTMSGSGTTTISSGATLTIDGGTQKFLDQRTIDNSGTITYTSTNSVHVENSAAISNNSTGIIDIQADVTVFNKNDTTLGTITNAGVFKKTSGSSTATIEMAFNNTNSASAESGTLTFVQGGSSSGTFQATTSNTLLFNTGTQTFDDVTFSGAGTIQLSSGTISVNSAKTLSVSAGTTFLINAGTLQGDGDIDINGATGNNGILSWTGGTLTGAGSTTINSNGKLSLGTLAANAYRFLDRAITNNGTTEFSSTGFYAPLQVSNSKTFTNNGTFDAQSDAALFANQTGSDGILANTGTFKKTTATGTTTIGIKFNNTGTTDGQSGILEINAGGTSSGTFDVQSGARLKFTSTTHTLNSATFGNTGTGGLEIESGTIDGSGFTISKTLEWTGGAIGDSDGGEIIVNASASLLLPSPDANAFRTLDYWTITNNGTITASGTGFYAEIDCSNGASITNNASAAILDIQSDATILDETGTGTASTLTVSAGTVKKSAGSGTATIDIQVDNAATVQSQTGTLALSRGGTSSGTFDASLSSTLQFSGGTHTFDDVTFSGEGTLQLSSGIVSVNSAKTLSVSAGTTFLFSAGTLQGAGGIDINGTTGSNGIFSWTGGTLTGTGGTTISSNGKLTLGTLAANAYRFMDRDITNNGTTEFSATGFYAPVQVRNSKTLTNNGTFDVQSDAALFANESGSDGILANTGTFKKTTATGTATTGIKLNNSGTTNAQSGVLDINAGGTSSGTFDAQSGARLKFTTSGATHTLNNASFGNTGTGGLEIESATIEGSGFTINKTLEWTGGAIGDSDGGSIIVAAGASLLLPSPDANAFRTLGYWSITNNGTITASGTGFYAEIDCSNGATITNNASAAIIDIQSDATILDETGTGTASVLTVSAGTVKKSAGTGTATIDIQVDNAATVQSQSGTLALTNGGSSSGTFDAALSSTLQFSGGTHTFDDVTFSGEGTVQLSSGTVSVNSAKTLSVSAGTTFLFSAGTLQGAGDIDINGTSGNNGVFSWTGGTLTGAGGTTISSNGKLTLGTLAANAYRFMDRTITNNGATEFSATGFYAPLQVRNSKTFTNNGTFDAQSDAALFANESGSDGVLANTGTFKKTTATGTTTTGIKLNNSGTTDAQSGILQLNGGGTSSGTFDAQSGARLKFTTATPPHTLNSATIGNTGTGALEFESGTIAGTGFTINKTLEWTGGAIGDSDGGSVTVASSGTLQVPSPDANAFRSLDYWSITNNGTITATAAGFYAAIRLSNGSGITNNSSTAIFDIQSDATIVEDTATGGAGSVSVSAGTLKKSAGTGTATIAAQLNSSGIIEILSGTLKLTQGSFENGSGGTLRGGGTLDVSSISFTNSGGISPGTSPDILSVSGAMTQGSGGTTNIELGGTTVETEYDRLAVSGAATLGGTIEVTLIGSYEPDIGDQFEVVTYASRSGTFSTVNLPTLSSGKSWNSTYGATSFLLEVQASTDVDLSLTKTDSPADTVVAGEQLRYTITVQNNSTASAANTVLNDTVPSQVQSPEYSLDSGTSWTTWTGSLNLGTIANGGSKQVLIRGTVQTGFSGAINNTASVSADPNDPDTSNNSASASTNAVTSASKTFTTDETIDTNDNTYHGYDIVVGDGTNAVTLTVNGSHRFASLDAKSNSTLTHSASTSGTTRSMALTVSGGVNVRSGATIDVDGKGYLGGQQGDNSVTTGRSTGNATGSGSTGASGGSYGGDGGNGQGGTAGATYGTASDPNEPGAGGGALSSTDAGGSGGGLVRITANGTITVNGIIRADGASGGNTNGGGGSGGGIYLNAATLAGSGTLRAHGGNGGTAGQATGGGSGGRIALHYSSQNNFSGSHTKNGGDGQNGGNTGDFGTLYVLYPMTVSILGGSEGESNGSVSSTPSGISCQDDCEENFASDTSVDLTATPDTGFEFSGWSGDASGTANPLTVSMDGPKSIDAEFSAVSRTLTTSVTSGNGNISSSPGGISCGSDCSENYGHGQNVQLTASPDSGWQFSHWEGDLTGSTNPATISMDGNKSVQAVFTQSTFTLTVSISPSGGGSVSGNGISCPDDCTETVSSGQSITLTASAASGHNFSQWSGDASGTNNQVSVTLNADKSVTANFSALGDTTRPTVNSTSPADGASGVAVNTTVNATFSEEMDGTTLTTSTFTLTEGSTNSTDAISPSDVGDPVSGSVSYPSSDNTAAFSPSANLLYNTTYTAKITTGVTDQAGNHMAAEHSWQFSTSDNNPPDTPTAVSHDHEAVAPSTTVNLRASAYNDLEGDSHTHAHWRIRKQGFGYERSGDHSTFTADLTSGVMHEHNPGGLVEGFKYYWKVGYKDSGSGRIAWSREHGLKIGTSTEDTSVQLTAGSSSAQFKMVCWPFWPDDPDSLQVFLDEMGGSYNTANFRIGSYNPENGAYTECGNNQMIEPGKATWILARNGLNSQVNGVPVSISEEIDVKMAYNASTNDGWNMIGPPNDAEYNWSDVQIVVYADSTGNTITYGPASVTDSASATYIDPRLWRYDNGQYFDDTTQMQSKTGYWAKINAANVDGKTVFLRYRATVQVAWRNPGVMLASGLRSGGRFIDRWIIGGTPAIAAGDSPPAPMGGLSSGGTADSSTGGGGGGGCFIGTAGFRSQPNATRPVELFSAGIGFLAVMVAALIYAAVFTAAALIRKRDRAVKKPNAAVY